MRCQLLNKSELLLTRVKILLIFWATEERNVVPVTPEHHGLKQNASAKMGTNQSGMRAQNERLVLSLVRRNGALAKSELARMTGLSAQTVSVIMRELEDDGFLQRREPKRGRVGQPSVPMALNPSAVLFYGLKIGRRSTDLVLTDFLGNVLNRSSTTYSHPTPQRTLEFAKTAFLEMQGQLCDTQKSRVSGLGVAVPFQLWNWAKTLGVSAGEMAEWRDFDLQSELSDLLGLSTYLQNDASAACGAELVFGDGEMSPDFMYLYIGYLIGGGIVLDGKLYSGPTGNAGAFGPILVPDGTGKTAQLMDIASLSILEQMLEQSGCDTKHMWQSPDGWRIDAKVLDQWLDNAANGIAHAVTSTLSVIDFSTVIIEGWMPPQIKEDLVARVRQGLSGLDMSGLNSPRILKGNVGPDARSLGAACLPLSDRYLLD